MHIAFQILSAAATANALACPMSELVARGLAPEHLKERYLQGKGLGDPLEARQSNGPPIFDPLSGVLSPLGLGSLTPRSASPRSAEHNHLIEEHVRSRLEERDEDVNIDAPILTPKAHKKHYEKRGLVGGLLAPLTGPLAALDIPTPQDSGLKAMYVSPLSMRSNRTDIRSQSPGKDPNHQYQAPGPTDVRGDCVSLAPPNRPENADRGQPTLNTLANHGYLSRTGVTSFAEAANGIQEACNTVPRPRISACL